MNLPFLHMSHSPAAQVGHGTGSGRRTTPTDQVAGPDRRVGRRFEHPAHVFVPDHQSLAAGRGLPAATQDLGVGAADAGEQPLD